MTNTDLKCTPLKELIPLLRAIASHPAGLRQTSLDEQNSLQFHGMWGHFFFMHGSEPFAGRKIVESSIAFELQCRSCLGELAELLAPLDIPVLITKGLSLSLALYGQAGLRSFGDVDLVVPPGRTPELDRCLQQLGYKGDSLFQNYTRHSMKIDLHEHPLSQVDFLLPSKVLASWWSNRARLETMPYPFFRLSYEHEFILGLIHGAKHSFSRAYQIYDLWSLSKVCSQRSLFEEIQSLRLGRHLWLARECLKTWFDQDFHHTLVEACSPPPRLDWVSRTITRRVVEGSAPDYLGMLTPLWASPSLWMSLRYLQKTLPDRNQKWWKRAQNLLFRTLQTLFRKRD